LHGLWQRTQSVAGNVEHLELAEPPIARTEWPHSLSLSGLIAGDFYLSLQELAS
jgi:hypothetical protein